MSKSKKTTVSLVTFKSWKVEHIFGYEVDADTNKVCKVWCKCCAKYSEKIRRDNRLRGKAKEDVLKFVEGTTFITKWTVKRHCECLVSILKIQ